MLNLANITINSLINCHTVKNNLLTNEQDPMKNESQAKNTTIPYKE
jgi:hypothetical protein